MDYDVQPGDKEKCDETKSTHVLERENLLNDDVSDDMFSDDDNHESPVYKELTLHETNNLNDEDSLVDTVELVPTEAFVPLTPMSLAPLMNKCDQTWTSDMETPVIEPKQNVVSPVANQVIEKTKGEYHASPVLDEEPSGSPVFMNKKKKRPKRRIFKPTEQLKNVDYTEEQPDQSHQSDISETTSTSCENSTVSETPTVSTLKPIDEVQTVQNVSEKLNTSSQDFFNNASFSMVDKVCQDHAEGSKNPAKEQTTVDLLKSCRLKLKSRWSKSSLREQSILQSSMEDNSAERELLSLKPTGSKSSVSKMPSGVTATQLLSQINEPKEENKTEDEVEDKSEETSGFKKPTDVPVDLKSTIRNTENDRNMTMNSTAIESQLIACCDMAEFAEDMNDFWPGQSKSPKIESPEKTVAKNGGSSSTCIPSGFKTASGQNIAIDKTRLQRVSKLYEEFMQPDESFELVKKPEKTVMKNVGSSSSSISSGFKPAFRQNISIDKTRLQQASKQSEEFMQPDEASVSTGFKTAAGSTSVDKTRLVRTKNLYNEVPETEPKKKQYKTPISTGFKSESGSSTSVDKTELVRAQNLYNKVPGLEQKKIVYEIPISTGFKTAAGSKIVVEKNKLDQVQSLYKEFVEESIGSEDGPSSASTTVSSGFKTPIREAIPIKKNLLDRVKTDFKDDLVPEPIPEPDQSFLKEKKMYLDEEETNKKENEDFEEKEEKKDNEEVEKTVRRGLKRKWLSDSDISSHSTTAVPEPTFNLQPNPKSNTLPQKMLKKSVSMDNFFDFDTDFVMSTINIPQILEPSTNSERIERYSTYPLTSNSTERVSKRLSLPETNLRKQAIRNAAINHIPINEEFRGFSQEELQQSQLNIEMIDRISSPYSVSLDSLNAVRMVDDSIRSSQLRFERSSEPSQDYFSAPSSSDLHSSSYFSSQEIKRFSSNDINERDSSDSDYSTPEAKTRQIDKTVTNSSNRVFHERGLKFICGQEVSRSEVISNIANPLRKPCIGFPPPSDESTKMLDQLIVNLERESACSPAFDFYPGVNTSKASLNRAKELLAYWKVEESKVSSSPKLKNVPLKKSNQFQQSKVPTTKTPILKTPKTNLENVKIPQVSSGFRTAAGQNIQISSEILKKARQLVEDQVPKTEMAFSGGFKTAAGSSIAVSKESLNRARKLMDLEDDQEPSVSKTPTLGGFRTAAGKSINVSEQSLKKARKLFESDSDGKMDTPGFGGFRTAGGQSINISKENLEKARKRFPGFEDGETESPVRKRFSLNQNQKGDSVSSKRKLENDTPTSRFQLDRLKKPRVVGHVQARTIFDEEDGRDEKKGTEESPAALGGTPTSPIVVSKRRKMKKKIVAMSRTIQENEKEVVTDRAKRYSLPVNFGGKKEREEFVCTFDRSDDVETDRLGAGLLQDKIINMKKRNKPKPILGSLLSYRTENKHRRTSWKDVSGEKAPTPKTIDEIIKENLDPKIVDITSSNAVSYSFHISHIAGQNEDVDNIISVNLPDGVRLLINETGQATVAEFRRAFLACPGVDPALIPVDWIDNHYSLIVWKLASIDRMKFDGAVVPRALTPSRVIEELKYRYDREIDRSQRSALRKILEKDETASKRMVLCVSSIEKLSSNENQEKDKTPTQSSVMRKVFVTDGWYTIPITYDFPMLHYLTRGLVKEGTKIVTYGAELQNCERGCHPLEKDSGASLKIHSNATRRARWDTKLGFQKNVGPFQLKLQNVEPNSGLVGKVTVVISRIFPMLYREKLAGGKSVYRNARCEEKAVKAYEQECEKQMEKFYAKAQQDFMKNSRGDSQGWDDEDGTFSESQSRQVQAHRQAKQEEFKQKLDQEMRANLPPRRQVTPVLKLRVADEDVSALVTIWSGGEDVADSLKEGSCVSIYNASASGRRNGELNLSINSFSFFKPESSVTISHPGRKYSPITDLYQPNFKPAYNEFDTVGIVSSITDAPRGQKNFEVVNIAFPVDDTTSKYLSLYFWQGVSTSGYSNVLVKGSIIACSNLEWRCNSSFTVPAGYYNEKTSISCNPRQPHLREPFEKLKRTVKNPMIYATKCAEEIAQEFEKMSVKHVGGTPSDRSTYSNSPQTPGLQNRSDLQTPVRANLIQKRLDKLSRYGEAPALSPIVTQSSSRVKSEFIPLQRTPNPN